jgi:TolB-like protein/Flp pilus assembly protein TadD
MDSSRRAALVENGRSEIEYELRLIGRVRLIRHDGVEVTPKGRKAQGLLALLGATKGLRRPRAWLQDKLWSDRGAEQGSASLRQELAGLRRSFGGSDCLLAEGGWVGFDPARVRVRLDPDPEDWELTGTPPEFAAGLDIADPEFEDWIRDQRAAIAERLSAVPHPDPVAPRLLQFPAAEPEEPITPSIAIMPLVRFAEGGDADFVATGLVLDVIGRLTRFRRIDVIAYASTVALGPVGLPPREIGRRLGVRYMTQGALWLGRSRMQLTFDLVDVTTERVLWNQSFDRPYDDLFEVESEIAAALAGGVMVEVDQLERSRLRARDPATLAAYELCLRGLDEMLSLERAGCLAALGYFTRAAERERQYARALAGISRAHGFQWKYRWTEERERALAEAETYALRAVDADANDPSAFAGLGWVALYERQHDRSLAAYSRAMELNPSDADILAEYADALSHYGLNDQAIPLFERAMRLNPQMSDMYSKDLAYTYLKAEDYEASIKTIRSMHRPQIADIILAASLALAGRDEEARRAAEAVRRAHPGFSPDAWITMVPDLNADDTARYLEGMKRAGL